jgi:hypothetical protein
MDVARADTVDAELDRLISKRASQDRRPDPDEQEELWRASEDVYNEKRRQMARLEWHAFHSGQAERHRRPPPYPGGIDRLPRDAGTELTNRRRRMTTPTIIGDATGSTMPNPAYYGFDWPELQAALDRGQALWDKKGEIGREQQALGEEKKRLEADLVKAEAGATLASVGLGSTEIGDAGFAVDAPKAQKRLRAIEKRAGELDAQRAGLDLAIQRHKGGLEKTLMVARQDGRFASEIEAANAGDLSEAQDLEAQLQAIRARIQGREQLGTLLGMHAGEFVA